MHGPRAGMHGHTSLQKMAVTTSCKISQHGQMQMFLGRAAAAAFELLLLQMLVRYAAMLGGGGGGYDTSSQLSCRCMVNCRVLGGLSS